MKKVVFALISLSYITSLVFVAPTGVAHAAVPVAGKADAGAASFKRYCAGCHSVDPDHKLMGPNLCSEMRGPHRKATKDVQDIIVEVTPCKQSFSATGCRKMEKGSSSLSTQITYRSMIRSHLGFDEGCS